jgi:hypothetical protein
VPDAVHRDFTIAAWSDVSQVVCALRFATRHSETIRKGVRRGAERHRRSWLSA